jgi:hypothetical protein
MKKRGKLKGSQLLSSPLEAEIFHNPVLIEQDHKAIPFLLDPRVLKNNKVGEIGFFESQLRRVLAKISVDKDVSVILLLNPIRRPKDLKNLTLGGRTDLDFFIRIVSDLGAHIDPSDATTTRQDREERD